MALLRRRMTVMSPTVLRAPLVMTLQSFLIHALVTTSLVRVRVMVSMVVVAHPPRRPQGRHPSREVGSA